MSRKWRRWLVSEGSSGPTSPAKPRGWEWIESLSLGAAGPPAQKQNGSKPLWCISRWNIQVIYQTNMCLIEKTHLCLQAFTVCTAGPGEGQCLERYGWSGFCCISPGFIRWEWIYCLCWGVAFSSSSACPCHPLRVSYWWLGHDVIVERSRVQANL